MSREDLNGRFSRLESAGYQITSEATYDYNCHAWAAGDTTRWWDGDKTTGYYWPPDAADGRIVEAAMHAFSLFGYRPCANGDLEEGFEKIAIYGKPRDGEYEHTARQLPDGTWTSKLGGLEDITHNTVEALFGESYGVVLKYMKRPRDQGTANAAESQAKQSGQ